MERQTRQRQAVLDALARSGRTLSPPEILELAQRQAPGLNLSTVYRQVKALEQAGTVVKVQLPGEAARFEVRCTQAMAPSARAARPLRAAGSAGLAGDGPASAGLANAGPASAGPANAGKGAPRAHGGERARGSNLVEPSQGTAHPVDGHAGGAEIGHGHGHDEQAHADAHDHDHDHHHHHFHCLRCDQVVPIHGCPGPMHDLAPPGFIVEQHDLVLHGRCAACARSEASA